jgi:hypothetical protein
MIDYSVMLSGLDKEQQRAIDDIDEKLIGYLTFDGDAEVELPAHGIRRPSWFKPGGATLSDVNAAALQLRRTT